MKRILIVEDDPVGKVVMQKMLESDFKCTVVESADEALNLASREQFDGLILDINLGVGAMDGCELLSRLRDMEGYGGIRAVATTAYAMEGDRERFLNSGFNAYVAKPVRVVELLDTVHGIFQ